MQIRDYLINIDVIDVIDKNSNPKTIKEKDYIIYGFDFFSIYQVEKIHELSNRIELLCVYSINEEKIGKYANVHISTILPLSIYNRTKLCTWLKDFASQVQLYGNLSD